ncbi:MAG TPA: FlgO family outer membrane protein [Cyclobacteriaceae bacterium]|nr:FlgO family outer membrane protein [Cyclobacteriaceae bacterium]
MKCLIFIPIISQTYCDTRSFAWQQEFMVFNRMARNDQYGPDIRLKSGNVASRILPVKIHDLDADDQALIEKELGRVLRAIEFIYKDAGVNRPLRQNEEEPAKNQNHNTYRNQINKVANAIKEITQGVKNAAPAPRQESSAERVTPASKQPTDRKLVWVIAAALLLGGGVFGWWKYAATGTNASTNENNSIAVLPFVNMSNDAEQEYFSDGITEQIITNLAHIQSLKVIARTSVMKFKKTDKSIAEIGKELNVTHILEGSIRKSNDRIRVTAQLIAVKDEAHIWAQDYDRSIADIFTVQDEVSMAIAGTLERQMTSREMESLKTERPKNIEAYQHYLRGYHAHIEKFYVNLHKEDFFEAEKEFLTTIELDPDYAQAYAGLADLYDTYRNFATTDPKEIKAFDTKRDSLARVGIRLNPNNPYALVVMALSFSNRPDRTEAFQDSAMKYLRRAIKIAPNNLDACDALGVLYSAMGLQASALQLRERVIDLDPTFGQYHANLAQSQILMGQLDRAKKSLQRALLLQPDGITGLTIWLAYNINTNNFQELPSILEKIPSGRTTQNLINMAQGILLARQGKKAEALARSHAPQVYMAQNMHEEAIDAMVENPIGYYPMLNFPVFDPLRNNPRFIQLLAERKAINEARHAKYGL